MGLTPSPTPLTRKEFEKALSEGKTTMEEIDPAFAEWMKYGHFGKNIISTIFNRFRRKDIEKLNKKIINN
jgi:hypothetical protein